MNCACLLVLERLWECIEGRAHPGLQQCRKRAMDTRQAYDFSNCVHMFLTCTTKVYGTKMALANISTLRESPNSPLSLWQMLYINKWFSFTYSPGTSLTIAFVPGPRISETTYILQKKYRSPQFPHLPDIRSVGFQSQMFWEASYLQCQLPSIGEQHEAWTFLSFGTSSGSTRSFPFEGCHTRYVFFCDSPSLPLLPTWSFYPLLWKICSAN